MSQNFSKQNLRGRSFQHQDLTGANFSEADIRGTNFTGANLEGANFSNAQAGLQGRWVIGIVITSWLLSLIPEFILSLTTEGVLTSLIAPETIQRYTVLPCIVFLLLLTVCLIATVYKGPIKALKIIWRAFLIALAILVIAFIFIVMAKARMAADFWGFTLGFSLIFTVVLIIIISAFWAISLLLSLAFSVGGLAIIILHCLKLFLMTSGLIAYIIAQSNGGDFIIDNFILKNYNVYKHLTPSFKIAETIEIIFFSLSPYVAWQTVKGNQRFAFLRRIITPLAAIGGTSFRNANLTQSNFTRANLKNTDLREANLSLTCWLGVQNLFAARLGKTYLDNPKIQRLVTRGDGGNQIFDRLNLSYLNCSHANLNLASFVDSDLSGTNLEFSNLSQAKLLRTNLDKTDLTGACLTGAYIDTWGSLKNAKLEQIDCQYIFLLSANSASTEPVRFPVDRDFVDDELRQIIRPSLDTLDIYHEEEIKWEASRDALVNLAHSYQIPLKIVQVKKENDRVLIRVKTPEMSNHNLLLAEYFSRYYQMLQSSAGNPGPMRIDNQYLVTGVAKLVEILRNDDEDEENISLYHKGEMIVGENVSYTKDQRRIQTIKTDGGSIHISGSGAFNLGEIRGTVANTINQRQTSENQEKTELFSLLQELQEIIETESALNTDDKNEAIEQINLLQEIAANNNPGQSTYKAARKAIKVLRGTLLTEQLHQNYNDLFSRINEKFKI